MGLYNVLVKQQVFLFNLNKISLFWAMQSVSIFERAKIDPLNIIPVLAKLVSEESPRLEKSSDISILIIPFELIA